MKMLKLSFAPLLIALVLLATANAWANTAADTDITNTARLTYTGGSASASVHVRVSLVPSTPNISITNAIGAYTAPNTPALTDSVIITSTANGLASYTVSPSISTITVPVNSTGSTVGPASTTISLGATVTTGTSGTTYLTVPAPWGVTGNDATINGIVPGSSTIVFKGLNPGNIYNVAVTHTHDNGDGTYQLQWAATSAIPGTDIPLAATQVGEQKSVSLSVLPGTIQTAGQHIYVTVHAAVSTNNAADATVENSSPNDWSSALPNISMTKYVRNVTIPASNPPLTTNGDTSFTINGTTSHYFTSGVTGKPTDTLEYVIFAINNAGVGAFALSGCAITDLVPAAYVNFNLGSYGGGNRDVWYIDTTGAGVALAAPAVVGSSMASYIKANNPNLIVNVGDTATSTQTGNLPVTKSVAIAYQVTIQ